MPAPCLISLRHDIRCLSRSLPTLVLHHTHLAPRSVKFLAMFSFSSLLKPIFPSSSVRGFVFRADTRRLFDPVLSSNRSSNVCTRATAQRSLLSVLVRQPHGLFHSSSPHSYFIFIRRWASRAGLISLAFAFDPSRVPPFHGRLAAAGTVF